MLTPTAYACDEGVVGVSNSPVKSSSLCPCMAIRLRHANASMPLMENDTHAAVDFNHLIETGLRVDLESQEHVSFEFPV